MFYIKPSTTHFLHFSQLYMLSPLSSSAEKNVAKQSLSVMVGPQNQLQIEKSRDDQLFITITNFIIYIITSIIHQDFSNILQKKLSKGAVYQCCIKS